VLGHRDLGRTVVDHTGEHRGHLVGWVVVHTTWQGAGGIGGFFEKTFAPKGLGRIYDGILDKLAAEVEK
ncbi:hypothetical protein ABZ372_36915, partial [Streptomyces sp. NPDC005921]